jgi:hypothetical protein
MNRDVELMQGLVSNHSADARLVSQCCSGDLSSSLITYAEEGSGVTSNFSPEPEPHNVFLIMRIRIPHNCFIIPLPSKFKSQKTDNRYFVEARCGEITTRWLKRDWGKYISVLRYISVYRRAEVAIGPSAPHLASDWRKGLSAKHSPLRLSCTLPRAPPQF